MSTPREQAASIAETQIHRTVSLSDMLCDNEFRICYTKLVKKIQKARQAELDEAGESTHPEIRQEFAAEAGFLIGLEIGRRLGGAR
jgi:hypothetical protein